MFPIAHGSSRDKEGLDEECYRFIHNSFLRLPPTTHGIKPTTPINFFDQWSSWIPFAALTLSERTSPLAFDTKIKVKIQFRELVEALELLNEWRMIDPEVSSRRKIFTKQSMSIQICVAISKTKRHRAAEVINSKIIQCPRAP